MAHSTCFIVPGHRQSILEGRPDVMLDAAFNCNFKDAHSPEGFGADAKGEAVCVDKGEIYALEGFAEVGFVGCVADGDADVGEGEELFCVGGVGVAGEDSYGISWVV